MTKKEITKRYILFIISLFFTGLGIAFTKCGELGVTPVSSLANVLSIKFTFLSIGNWLIVTNCILILGQILILRTNFNPIQLLQIPLSLLFGYFTDFGMIIASLVPVNSYLMQLIMVFTGIVILAFGISLSVTANVILNSGEAIVKAISDTLKKEFGNVKVVFDISYVALSVLLSMFLFNGQIIGTREGTVLSAVLLGFVVKFFNKYISKPINKILTK